MATVFVKPTSPRSAPGQGQRELRFRHPAQGAMSRPLPADGDHWPDDTHTHRMIAEGSIELAEPLPADAGNEGQTGDTRTDKQRYADRVASEQRDSRGN